jgi:hypothetical protein
MFGSSTPGEGRAGRPQGSTKASTSDDEWEAKLLAQKVIKELVYQALHAERERDQVVACKLFLKYGYGNPAPRYPDEEEEESSTEIVIGTAFLEL